MKKIIGLLLFSLIFAGSLQAQINRPESKKDTETAAPVVKAPPAIYIIDDFDDGDFTKKVEWWKFDGVILNVAENNKAEFRYLGKSSLTIAGSTVNWFVGGMGTYLGIEGSTYNAIKLVVYGNGKDSGTVKLEFYDDDNRNWEVDIDKTKGWAPIADDIFSYKLKVDWAGWKVVTIPFKDFQDDNPEVGDDLWNPEQKDSSGGLLQLQMIMLSSEKAVGKLDIKIDTIKLFKQKG